MPRTLSRGRYTYYVIILVVCLFVLYWLVIRDAKTFLVPSRSMEPTLLPNDFIFTTNERVYRRGEIVVMFDPIDASHSSYIVKRIVAVGGDKVRVEGGALFLNDYYASEPYIMEPMKYEFPDPRTGFTDRNYTVPDGEVFVLGDNRNLSEDSTEWRTHSLPLKDVVGKVHFIYLPFARMQTVISYPLVNARGG